MALTRKQSRVQLNNSHTNLSETHSMSDQCIAKCHITHFYEKFETSKHCWVLQDESRFLSQLSDQLKTIKMNGVGL